MFSFLKENLYWVVSLFPPVPEAPPQHLVATSNISSRIHLSWDPPPPEKHHGKLEGYRIQYISQRDLINRVITLEDPTKTVGVIKYTLMKGLM